MPPSPGGALLQEGSLVQLMQRQMLAPWNFIYDASVALAWSLQVGEALQRLHSGGVLHRDIKAENVLLTASPSGGKQLVAKLGDLGLHKVGH